ncbi:MAG: hypothetical protein MZV65_33705 [Chromatiales bacterium]|nr:hypothetical protein [Chromatiales bacterium]
MLLDSGTPGFDALVAPGHVATVMGPEEWQFVVERHGIPGGGRGLRARESLLAAFYSVLRQKLEGRLLPRQLLPAGRASRRQPDRAPHARRRRWTSIDANWRGIGIIPASGYALQAGATRAHDARLRFPSYDRSRPQARRRDAARLRLRAGGAGQDLPQRMPSLWPRLHPAQPDRPVHGVRRRRVPHLVGGRGAGIEGGGDWRLAVSDWPDWAGATSFHRRGAEAQRKA